MTIYTVYGQKDDWNGQNIYFFGGCTTEEEAEKRLNEVQKSQLRCCDLYWTEEFTLGKDENYIIA